MAGRDWTWVEGNHDAGPVDLGGSHRAILRIGPLTFRHVVDHQPGEIGGHFHPKARIGGTARPCFLIDSTRVILPAFGSYTGGLFSDDPTLTALMRPEAIAVITGARAIPVPMPRDVPYNRPRSSSFPR
jgi:metallophosphoesterase superfamily enzyme